MKRLVTARRPRTRMWGHSWTCMTALLAFLMPGTGAAAWQTVPETRIAESRLADPPSIQFDERRILVQREPADSLSRQGLLSVGPNGVVYVREVGGQQVHVVDAEGRGLRTLGGDGSASFHQLWLAAAARDSVIVMDLAAVAGRPAVRLHVFGEDGALLGSVDEQDDPDGRQWRQPPFRLYSTDTGWVTLRSIFVAGSGGPDDGPFVDTLQVSTLALDSSGFAETTMLTVPGPPRYSRYRLPQYMAFEPAVAVAADGHIFTTAEGYTIDVYSPSAGLERRIVGQVDRIPVTDAELQAHVDRAAGERRQRGGESEAEDWSDLALAVGRADFLPVLGRLLASRGGRLLVQRPDLESVDAGEGSVWDLIDAEAGLIGRATFPEGIRPSRFEWPHIYATVGPGLLTDLVRFRIAGES